MRYEQSAEQSAELLRLILPRITHHGGHFNPWAYAVWYEHLAEINPPLSEDLETRLRQNKPVTKAEIVELYGDHIQNGEARSLVRLQAGLGDLLRKLGEIAAQSSKGAADYYQALAAHEQELSSVVDANTLRSVLESLKNATASVRMKTSLLHTEIEAGREHMQSLHDQLHTLKGEALTDPLTGLHNRRGFDRACEQLYGDENAVCAGAAVLLVDIDRFKQINDTYGHLFGDQVLRAAAKVIADSVKGRDVAVRFGGDEFLVLLPDTSGDGALAVAEQIRAAFGRVRIRRSGSDNCIDQVTLSAGVAVAGSGQTMEHIIHRADETLYRAKAEGRNRVCVATLPLEALPTANRSISPLPSQQGFGSLTGMNLVSKRVALLSVCLLSAGLLSACGAHGDSDGGGVSATSAGPAPGTLLQNPPLLVSSTSAADLLAQLVTATNAQTFGAQVLSQVLALAGAPPCQVHVYHIEYNTLGGANESTTASGALMVPGGADRSCQGARPIVLYAHGTSTERNFNIADLTNQQNAEGILLAVFFAARGNVVVAPNYAGYDTSTLSYHPFLVGAQQSKDMIDALTAARSALPIGQVSDDGRLFITGYSQGGYVAMATHRAMQAAGMTVTASAPMSGPYALSAYVDAEFEGQVSGGAPVVATLLLDAYQKSYGNIYVNATDIFAAQYAPNIATLFPSTMSRSQLYAAGLLPQTALFDSTPPAPQFADITPPSLPANFAPLFAQGFGPAGLITNAYRLSYLQDEQASPDGGFPMLTNALPPAAPMLPWRQALKLNDLRNWTPVAPTLLCGGDQDPEVYYSNTQLMQAYWSAHAPATAPISVLDLDSPTHSTGDNGSLQADFQLAKQAVIAAAVLQGATDGGQVAVFEAYHATLVAPFCLAAAINFFNGQ